ncbi:MAG: FkbM family methyltransferase [bacterium]
MDILTNFKDKGTYIDVGANHPDIISVTKKFYERGWSGINIEPNYDNYIFFVNTRLRDINLNVGVSDKEGELDFFYKANASVTDSTGFTFSKDVYDARNYSLGSKKVKVIPLKKVFEENNINYVDFINIDTEGFENKVLESNDWLVNRAGVLCIEGRGYGKFLKKYGYRKVLFDGSNSFYKLKNI